jgi:glycosyltransferase involved in cell wall biosynthesis
MSELANYYAGRGVHVTLVTLDPPNRNDTYILSSHIIRKNVYFPFGNSIFTKAIAQIKRFLSLRHCIRTERPDAVLSFMTPVNILTILACIGLNVRCIVSERSHPGRSSYGRIVDLMRYLLYRFSSFVIVQTTEVADWLQARVKGAYVVIPNSVRETGHSTNTTREQRVVAVGRLVQLKAFDDLISAFVIVAGRFPSWRLDILGEGPQRPVLQALIDHHGLKDKIILHGFVSNPGILTNSAAIAAQPSRFEGFPNALLEAMASGLAVVASHEAGDMLIEDGVNGLLVPVSDVYRLAHALERLMEDAQLRTTLGQNALAVRDTYSRERVMPLWDSVLFPGHTFNEQKTSARTLL